MAGHEQQESVAQPTTDYEVRFPSNDDYHRLALLGLAGALGWEVQERTPDGTVEAVTDPLSEIDDGIVTVDGLRSVSAELFGATCYGDTANSILQQTRNEYKNLRIELDRHEIAFAHGPYIVGRRLERYIAPAGTPQEVIELRARRAIATTEAPFAVRFELRPDHYGSKQEYLAVVPMNVTAGRLSAFTHSCGYTTHALHGLVGKALDVLNVAAGSAEPRVSPNYDPGLFVPLADVMRLASEERLSKGVINTIMEKIGWALRNQAMDGMPVPKYGAEIVAEGQFNVVDMLDTPAAVRDFSVAVASLLLIGQKMPVNSKGGAFLQRLPELLQ
jgi:hypothetical protein